MSDAATGDRVPAATAPSWRLAAAIAGQGLGAGLISLVTLRWLGFLGMPPVWFLTLLLVGMPTGGLLLVRNRWLRGRDLATILVLAAGTAVVGVLLFVVALRLIDTRVDLSLMHDPATTGWTFLQYALAVAGLLPVFIGYGALELAAYRAGLAGLGGRSARVYALNLAGLCAAFVLYRLLLVDLGTSGLLIGGLLLLLCTALLLAPRRWSLAIAAGLCAALLLVPGRESATVDLLEVKTGRSTVSHYRSAPNRILHDAWTPHTRLTITDVGWGVRGFYDGLYHWSFTRGMPDPRQRPAFYQPLHLLFARLIRPGDEVAVLGAGGGLQVAAALRADAKRVVAVEVVPEVLEVLSGPLAASIDGTYRDPRVELVPKNARVFLRQTDRLFDAIIVASVESGVTGLRELFEPSQVMFTREALAEMTAHLAPGGILVISKHTAVDWRGAIFAQVLSELAELDVESRGYIQLPPGAPPNDRDPDLLVAFGTQYLVLAQKPGGAVDALATVDNLLRGTPVETIRQPPRSAPWPAITDDRAFATGMLIANIGVGPLVGAGIGLAALLLAIGAALALLLRRLGAAPSVESGQAAEPSGTPGGDWRLVLAAVAVGINFVTIEYLLVYRLMDRLDVPMNATFLGMIIFVALAAAGGLALGPVASPRLLKTSAVVAVALVVSGPWLPLASLVAIAAAAFIAGTLFPRLLTGGDRRLARVYVWDAYGALWGGLLALLIPLLLGFSGQQVAGGLALLIAVWGVHRAAGPTAPGEDA